ncbi:accessory gene regulator B family protein, partial [Eubacterium aggregans]|uniref:accessory gene regulator B family protein n=1 Tax=Eubacterium aggregans TaxID=81409 RepID=UPI0023F43104
MIKQWGQQMAEACCREGVLKEKNREAIAFGFEELIFVLINLVVIATIAAFTQELLNALIFCVIYLSLVRLVGIYHAKTRKGCFIKTMIVFVAYLLIMRGVPSDYYVIGSLGSFLFYLIT